MDLCPFLKLRKIKKMINFSEQSDFLNRPFTDSCCDKSHRSRASVPSTDPPIPAGTRLMQFIFAIIGYGLPHRHFGRRQNLTIGYNTSFVLFLSSVDCPKTTYPYQVDFELQKIKTAIHSLLVLKAMDPISNMSAATI